MKDKEAKRIKELNVMDQRLPDEMNPIFLFSTTHTELLVQIAKGTIRAKKLALQELGRRGLNKEGFWVGHKKKYDRGR